MPPVDKTQRRKELLLAARNVFASHGYHRAKIDDIVAEANVSKGTFYLYFTDKRSIFEELVDNLFERLQSAITRVEVAHDVEAQVKQNIRAIVNVLLEDPALTHIFFSYAPGLDPEFIQKVRSFYAAVRVVLETALRDGQALGIVAPGDANLFATFTLGGLKELLLDTSIHGPMPQDRAEHLVADLFQLLQGGYLRISSR